MRIRSVSFSVDASAGEGAVGRMSGVKSYKTQARKRMLLDQFRTAHNTLCSFPSTSVFSGKNKIPSRVRKDENTGHNYKKA